MRKFLLSIIIALILVTVPATTVLADTSATVTITARGVVVGTPEGLVITYIENTLLQIDWTKGDAAVNTMVRARYGSVPEDRTDGYLVYYGVGETATDTSVDIDNTINTIYYRAWSQNAAGAWEDIGTTNFFEEGAMTLLFFAVLAIGVTWVGTKWRFYGLNLMGACAWIIFALYVKGNPPLHLVEGDSVHTALLVLLFGVGLMVAIAGLGRGISKKQKSLDGNFEVVHEGGFGFHMPDWMNDAKGETQVQATRRRQEETDDYRSQMHRALHQPRRRR